MSFRAAVLKVMIASPSDVTEERQHARDVIYEWNALNSEDQKVVLLPVGWETHASPEMGDRPQAILNRQLLASCDVLVAIFYAKLGTPTGVAPSGTVEELDEHVRAGKRAMVYFSTANVPHSVDVEQLQALRAFKASIRTRGYFHEYDGPSAFKGAFASQLTQAVRLVSLPSDLPATSAAPGIDPATRAHNYRFLSEEAKTLLLAAVNSSDSTIMYVEPLDGSLIVQIDQKNYAEDADKRRKAKLRAAVLELIRAGFVEDRSSSKNREVLAVTDAGFVVEEEPPF
jgi:hypothetical protein